MASYIQFFKKGVEKPEAMSLVTLDEEICNLVGDKVHPRTYCRGWFDSIAFYLAMGRTYADVRKTIETNDASYAEQDGAGAWISYMMPILDHLEANYTTNSWSGR